MRFATCLHADRSQPTAIVRAGDQLKTPWEIRRRHIHVFTTLLVSFRLALSDAKRSCCLFRLSYCIYYPPLTKLVTPLPSDSRILQASGHRLFDTCHPSSSTSFRLNLVPRGHRRRSAFAILHVDRECCSSVHVLNLGLSLALIIPCLGAY